MDLKQIKSLMKEFDESGLCKLKLKQEDTVLELEKPSVYDTSVAVKPVNIQPATSTVPTFSAPEAESPVVANELPGEKILSPMVGTFYHAPSPDAPPFVKKGDTVRKGQTIAIIEAMKIMNELEAEYDCKVVDILVENGQPVEYDMPLYMVEKV